MHKETGVEEDRTEQERDSVQTMHVSQTTGQWRLGVSHIFLALQLQLVMTSDCKLWSKAQRIIKKPLLYQAGSGESAKQDWRQVDSGIWAASVTCDLFLM